MLRAMQMSMWFSNYFNWIHHCYIKQNLLLKYSVSYCWPFLYSSLQHQSFILYQSMHGCTRTRTHTVCHQWAVSWLLWSNSLSLCLISLYRSSAVTPWVCLSICLSVCLCTALSKSLYKHKGAREASTCNFSAINRPMKHSSESSYYSFPIPPSWKSKIALSFPPSDPVNPSIALQHKHLSALDAVALNAACNVRHHQTGACLSCLLKEKMCYILDMNKIWILNQTCKIWTEKQYTLSKRLQHPLHLWTHLCPCGLLLSLMPSLFHSVYLEHKHIHTLVYTHHHRFSMPLRHQLNRPSRALFVSHTLASACSSSLHTHLSFWHECCSSCRCSLVTVESEPHHGPPVLLPSFPPHLSHNSLLPLCRSPGHRNKYFSMQM